MSSRRAESGVERRFWERITLRCWLNDDDGPLLESVAL